MPNWMLDHTGTITVISLLSVGGLAATLTIYSAHVRNDEKKAKSAATATFVSTFILTILSSVFLSNLFAQKRDRDQRVWTLSQQHLTRLKPILRLDATVYDELIKRVTVSGYVTDLNNVNESVEKQLDVLFSPDILSPHLQIHFPEYYQQKHSLQNAARQLDEEFRSTFTNVKKRIVLPPLAESRRTEVALSVLTRCMKKGPGIRLIIQGNYFNYSANGGSTGGSGQPSPDMFEAFRAFSSFHDSTIQAQCDDILNRENLIVTDATKLKQEVLMLAELATLPNSCEYTKPLM